MKSEFFQQRLAWGLLYLLTCCGCSRLQQEVAPPAGFGLMHRNVESTTLPPVRQVNHVQLIEVVQLEEENDETAGEFLQRQFEWMVGRGRSRPASIRLLADAEQVYNRATNARATGNGVNSDDEIESLYLEAAKIYDSSARRWSNSNLHEDALFMAAESYFFGQRYPEADDRYERLLKDYPKSRYLDQIQQRRFSIAHYWLQTDQLDHQKFYEFNLMDPTLPWRDQFNFSVRILDQIRLDDPTGDIADDATLLAADACLEIGRYHQADNLFSDLIKTFPSSEHQFRAHRAAIQTKILRYRGPEYGETTLLESEKLLKQVHRQNWHGLKPKSITRRPNENGLPDNSLMSGLPTVRLRCTTVRWLKSMPTHLLAARPVNVCWRSRENRLNRGSGSSGWQTCLTGKTTLINSWRILPHALIRSDEANETDPPCSQLGMLDFAHGTTGLWVCRLPDWVQYTLSTQYSFRSRTDVPIGQLPA